MKHSARIHTSSIAIATALFLAPAAHGLTQTKSFLTPRPQASNAPRELVGWQPYINLAPQCQSYGSGSITGEYVHSFESYRIADYFFSSPKLTFSGSRALLRGNDDILADYFGLPTDFESCVLFCPFSYAGIIDLNYYIGLDGWHNGLYFRIHTPIVHMRNSLGLHETIDSDSGTLNYPAGYMASSLITPNDMHASVKEAFKGKKSVGDIQPLRFGKIDCDQTRTGLADIIMAFGYNFVLDIEHHFGWNVRLGIPTGNIPQNFYLFEPLIGNGGHWEFGVGLTGHSVMWQSKDARNTWSIYGDINLMNMHPNWQRRSFDLKNNGPLSRYILIEQIGTPIVEGLTVGGDVAEQQYHGVVLPAVNATTLNSRIGIGAEGELVLKISYQHDAWAFDIGYNLWGRTGESLHCRSSFPDDTYAVKGDAQIYGFDPTPRFVGLNATQTFATIHAGQDDGNANLTFTNANADNHAVAEFQGNALTQSFSPDGIVDTGLTAGTIAAVQGSNQAILLNDCDIDNASALAPAVVSQKIFFHINRSWDDDGTTVPYFGFGGEVELDMGTRRSHGALSQWGFWIKAGIAY